MQCTILTWNKRRLARGAAILLVAGLSAGCSSDLMRFDRSLTASTTASQPVYQQQQAQAAPVYQEPQPYPGVDQTTTASINRGAVQQPNLLRNSVRRDRKAPVPSADVGTSNATPRQPLPRPQAATQPFPAQPRQQTAQVTRQPLALPAPDNIDRTVTGSVQKQAKAPTSAPDATQKVAAASRDLPAKVPLPENAPTKRVAVLPQPAKVPERADAQGTADAARTTTTGAVYTVVAGDTLSGIAQKTGSSTSAIKQANGLDSGLIRVGQKLVIPGGDVKETVASATPPGVDPIVTGGVTKPSGGNTAPEAKEAESEKVVRNVAAAPEATGVGRLRWPVHGRIVSGFGSQNDGKRNDGIDIAVPEGTPVKAAENGVVIYAGDGLKDFGNTVLVRHENGLVTVYGHNSEIIVSRGTTVRRGQELARSGHSGNAGSPKLHFEVRKDSAPVDPAQFLE